MRFAFYICNPNRKRAVDNREYFYNTLYREVEQR